MSADMYALHCFISSHCVLFETRTRIEQNVELRNDTKAEN